MNNNDKQLKRFFKIIGFIVVPFIFIWIFIVSGYVIMNRSNPSPEDSGDNVSPIVDNDQDKVEDLQPPTEDENKPEYIIGAVLGLDKSELLTDVLMVGVFNTRTNMIDIFSVPRDTRVELSESVYTELNKITHVPKVMKINALHSYTKAGGVSNPETYVVSALEQILGLEIDHYIKINTRAFNEIVDAVDGVKIYVPQDMEYSDPYQDLYFHLKKGTQVLNGSQAEYFVRHRQGYSNGDLGRIEMQQYFLQSFVDSLLSWGTIPQIPGIINSLYTNVETDVSLVDALGYTKYLTDVNSNNLRTHTIPGEAMYIDRVSYYVYNSKTVKDYVKQQLNEGMPLTSNSKDKNIMILNGSYTDGLAAKFNDLLINNGYNIISIGNFDGQRDNKTRIIVSEEDLGYDLLEYFNYAEVIYNPELLEKDIHIKIIIGGSEN